MERGGYGERGIGMLLILTIFVHIFMAYRALLYPVGHK